MAPLHLPHSVPDKEKDVWIRIIAMRTREVQRMDAKSIEALLEDPVLSNVGTIPPASNASVQNFVWVLKRLIVISLDPTIAPPKRRDAYRDLQILMHRVKLAKSKKKESSIHANEGTAHPSCIAAATNGIEKNQNNHSNGKSTRSGGSNQDVATTHNRFRRGSGTESSRAISATTAITTGHSEPRVGDALDDTITRGVNNSIEKNKPTLEKDTLPGQPRLHGIPISSESSLPRPGSALHVQDGSGSGSSVRAGIAATQQDFGTAQCRAPSQNDPRQSNSVPSPLKKGGHVGDVETRKCTNENGTSQNGIATSPRQPVSEDHREPLRAQTSLNHNRWGPRMLQPGNQTTSTSYAAFQANPLASQLHNKSVAAPFITGLTTSGTAASSQVPKPLTILSAPASQNYPNESLPETSTVKGVNHDRPRRRPQIETPKIATVSQPMRSVPHKKWFTVAQPRFTGALIAYPPGEFNWTQAILTGTEVDDSTRRLYIWDPYWEMLDIRALTKTADVNYVAPMVNSKDEDKRPLALHQAVEVRVEVPLHFQKCIKGWGQKSARGGPYKTGDEKLLLRMLPCQPPQNPTGKKKKKDLMRSDYHLWPKGTFLLVDNVPVEIIQRKQQGHSHSEWNYTSCALDVTPLVETPASITISALCHDPEPYYLCAAVCRYRSPEMLYSLLMNSSIQTLRMEECIQLAITSAMNNTVCVIDDDVDHDTASPSSMLFQLSCPITTTPMKTPVRAHQCSHFQCFDLLNFLCANENVSGTRWECPVCNKQVISVFDLQHCSFTQMLVNKYSDDQQPPSRKRIEFFSDGQWKLLPEKRRMAASLRGSKRDVHID